MTQAEPSDEYMTLGLPWSYFAPVIAGQSGVLQIAFGEWQHRLRDRVPLLSLRQTKLVWCAKYGLTTQSVLVSVSTEHGL